MKQYDANDQTYNFADKVKKEQKEEREIIGARKEFKQEEWAKPQTLDNKTDDLAEKRIKDQKVRAQILSAIEQEHQARMDERKILAAKAAKDDPVPEYDGQLKKLKIKKLRNKNGGNGKQFQSFKMEYQNIDGLEENEFGKIVPK